MARLLDVVPENLQSLLPENTKEAIVVGSSAYELYPLTEGMCENLVGMISQIFHEMFVERGEEKVSDFDILTKEGRVAKFLSEALDLPEAEIKKSMTTSQLLHVAGVLYKQNFTMSFIPETSKKFVEELWDKFFRRNTKQSGMEVLKTVLENDHRLLIPRIELLRLMDSSNPLQGLEGTNSFPVNTDGDGSTSEDAIIGNVTSSEGRAATGTSGRRVAVASPAQVRAFKEAKLSGKKIAVPVTEESTSATD